MIELWGNWKAKTDVNEVNGVSLYKTGKSVMVQEA